jgi:hypothetical protein
MRTREIFLSSTTNFDLAQVTGGQLHLIMRTIQIAKPPAGLSVPDLALICFAPPPTPACAVVQVLGSRRARQWCAQCGR